MANCFLHFILFAILSTANPVPGQHGERFRRIPRFPNITEPVVASTQSTAAPISTQDALTASAANAHAASGQLEITAITPVQLSTILSSYAPVTFINTAGQGVFTQSAGISADTTFIPQSLTPLPSIVVSHPETLSAAESSMVATIVAPSSAQVPSSVATPTTPVALSSTADSLTALVPTSKASPLSTLQGPSIHSELAATYSIKATPTTAVLSTHDLPATSASPSTLALPSTVISHSPSATTEKTNVLPSTTAEAKSSAVESSVAINTTLALPTTKGHSNGTTFITATHTATVQIPTTKSSTAQQSATSTPSQSTQVVSSSQPQAPLGASSSILSLAYTAPAPLPSSAGPQSSVEPYTSHSKSRLTIWRTITVSSLPLPLQTAPSYSESSQTSPAILTSSSVSFAAAFPTTYATLRGQFGGSSVPTVVATSTASHVNTVPLSTSMQPEPSLVSSTMEAPSPSVAKSSSGAPHYRLIVSSSSSSGLAVSSEQEIPEAATTSGTNLLAAQSPTSAASPMNDQPMPTALPPSYTNRASLVTGNANALSTQAPAWSLVPVYLSQSGVSYIYITVTETIARATVTQTQVITTTVR